MFRTRLKKAQFAYLGPDPGSALMFPPLCPGPVEDGQLPSARAGPDEQQNPLTGGWPERQDEHCPLSRFTEEQKALELMHPPELLTILFPGQETQGKLGLGPAQGWQNPRTISNFWGSRQPEQCRA